MAEMKNRYAESKVTGVSFTPRAEETFYEVVDSPDFSGQDAQLIYRALRDQLRAVSFCDYLKRYIYRKAEIRQPFDQVPLSEYLDIVTDSFISRGVPASFDPTTVRIRAGAKNWLTRQAASRDTVLLIGFGLRMTLAEVEELLVKGLQETRLDLNDPKEVLCAYCYEHGFGYYRYKSLEEQCASEEAGPEEEMLQIGSVRDLPDEKALQRYVSMLRRGRAGERRRTETVRQFHLLYREACGTAASILKLAGRNDALQPEDITPSDIEQILQAAIPKDRHGNLLPMKESTLYNQFRGRRLTRQRLDELMNGSAVPNRYDLIMLHFFSYSQRISEGLPRLQFYQRFTAQTNQILARCGMGPIYSANPFECFLLMCVLSEDPMGTYADVMEQSYREAAT